jgi:hypothetical protein
MKFSGQNKTKQKHGHSFDAKNALNHFKTNFSSRFNGQKTWSQFLATKSGKLFLLSP